MSERTPHTPGPWTTTTAYRGIDGTGGTQILITTADFDEETGKGEILFRQSDYVCCHPLAVQRADANLAAAAPALLAALRDLLQAYAPNADQTARESGERSLHSAVRAARAAIAAAEGTETAPEATGGARMSEPYRIETFSRAIKERLSNEKARPLHILIFDNERVIATVPVHNTQVGHPGWNAAETTAALLAQAPAMYAALDTIARGLTNGQIERGETFQDIARAAIRAAEGGA